MKAFKNITEKEILCGAYHHILDLYFHQKDLLEKAKEIGGTGYIAQHWVNKYKSQLDEIHQAILEIERSEQQ